MTVTVKTANRLPEIIARSQTGAFCKGRDFDMTLAMKTAELVREYGMLQRRLPLPEPHSPQIPQQHRPYGPLDTGCGRPGAGPQHEHGHHQ